MVPRPRNAWGLLEDIAVPFLIPAGKEAAACGSTTFHPLLVSAKALSLPIIVNDRLSNEEFELNRKKFVWWGSLRFGPYQSFLLLHFFFES